MAVDTHAPFQAAEQRVATGGVWPPPGPDRPQPPQAGPAPALEAAPPQITKHWEPQCLDINLLRLWFAVLLLLPFKKFILVRKPFYRRFEKSKKMVIIVK